MTTQLPIVTQANKTHPQNHLQTLLDGFVDFRGVENYDLSFKGLSANSKKVLEGYLFLACAGSSILTSKNTVAKDGQSVPQNLSHGIAYAGDAINRGATCIAWEPTSELQSMPEVCESVGDGIDEQQAKRQVPLIRVESLHNKIGEIAARFYQHPSKAMAVIGITGTNGKTSTCHYIAQLSTVLEQIKADQQEEQNEEHDKDNQDSSSSSVAVIGTLGNGLYGELEQSTHTTPDAVTLQTLMADFKSQQVKTVVMEVSSHALSQGRVNGVDYDIAVLTNLTRDHLDYHGDMETYASEKLKLFQFSSLKHIVLNHDDDFAGVIEDSLNHDERVMEHSVKVIRYSQQDDSVDLSAQNIQMTHHGITFTLCSRLDGYTKQYPVQCNLVGHFNIDNLLASIAVLYLQGFDIDAILNAIKGMTTVPGRMEKVTLGNESKFEQLPMVVIDYAHTPDALEKALSTLKEHTQGHLYCIFGCGGDRDKGKRKLMGQVAQIYADTAMVTSDNPRSEQPEQIISEILKGIDDHERVLTQLDRKQAIEQIIQMAKSDDVILIAGKGHEDYQEINGQRFPFSDKVCAVESLTKAYHGLSESKRK